MAGLKSVGNGIFWRTLIGSKVPSPALCSFNIYIISYRSWWCLYLCSTFPLTTWCPSFIIRLSSPQQQKKKWIHIWKEILDELGVGKANYAFWYFFHFLVHVRLLYLIWWGKGMVWCLPLGVMVCLSVATKSII